jgi:hypothetical protein
VGTYKVQFNFFLGVLGIFDWSITKKINQALDNPEIDILQSSPPLGWSYRLQE